MPQTGPDLKLERFEESSFLKYLTTLATKDATTIRIFERPSDVYSVHGDDAVYFSQTVYHTTTALKYMGSSSDVPYCTMTTLVFNNFLKDALLSKGLKIEVYEGKSNSWKITKRVCH